MFIFIVHPSPSLLDFDLSFLSFFLANITDEYFDLRTGWMPRTWPWRWDVCLLHRESNCLLARRFIIIIIIIRSRRQQRSVASTQSGHDDEPWTIRHECWRVYHRRSAGSMNGAGVLVVAANQDQNGGQFLLLRPVIMRGELACGHRVSPP